MTWELVRYKLCHIHNNELPHACHDVLDVRYLHVVTFKTIPMFVYVVFKRQCREDKFKKQNAIIGEDNTYSVLLITNIPTKSKHFMVGEKNLELVYLLEQF